MSEVSVSSGFKERHVLCMPFQKFEHFLKAFCKTFSKDYTELTVLLESDWSTREY